LKAGLLLQDRSQMEVDHIVPTAPGNYGAGCHNHLTNLRVLCHTHHNERTQKYRQELRKSRNNATT
jgi:5-methylcytosine-specific restriction endonuclease McrA